MAKTTKKKPGRLAQAQARLRKKAKTEKPAKRKKELTPKKFVKVAEIPTKPDSPKDLGPIELPPAENQAAVLQKIAELNDKCFRAKEVADEQATKAKNARARWTELCEELQREIRIQTHPSDLPLFANNAEREADQQAMEEAAR